MRSRVFSSVAIQLAALALMPKLAATVQYAVAAPQHKIYVL